MASSADLRQRISNAAIDGAFRAASSLGRLSPKARPSLYGIEIRDNLAYRATGDTAHLLDVWVPPGPGPFPVVLYLHGGGFRILSKDTHWPMALRFSRAGFVVVNASYRLAPTHPFPAALEDAVAAFEWMLDHVSAFGGDPSRVVLSGESAGANLALGTTLAACARRPEPYARRVFERGVVPKALVPMCGLFQVSDMERFRRAGSVSRAVYDRMRVIEASYLGASALGLERTASGAASAALEGAAALADPLVMLEQGLVCERPLPPVFASVGGADSIVDDTRRLAAELRRRGTRAECPEYPGQVHAFQALPFGDATRRSWSETFRFLAELGLCQPREERVREQALSASP